MKYAIITAILALGLVGCQYNGKIDASNLLDGSKIVLTKEPLDPQTVDSPIQEKNYPGYSIGSSEDSDQLVESRLFHPHLPERFVVYHVNEGGSYVWAYGQPLTSLPSGTVTYGGDKRSSSFALLQVHQSTAGNYGYSARGYVEVEANFDDNRITRLDAIALLPQQTYPDREPEKIIEIGDSNSMTIDSSSGKFAGTATLTVTPWKDDAAHVSFANSSPYELTVKGHFHGNSEVSALSGVLYAENAKGAFIAECKTCE